MSVISLVTGASSGLGKEIAKLLCKKGHIVYVVARRKEKLLELQKECVRETGKIIIISGDLSIHDFRGSLIKKILDESKKIDYLINNAGLGRAIKLEDIKTEEIHNMFEVNITTYIHLSSLVLKNMKEINKGRIINVGSVVAFTPLPYFTAYNSTKSAVYAFNRSLRYELKDSKVTSSVVLPARMKTGFAEKAYDCYMEDGKKVCVEKFNKVAGNPEIVAKSIVKNLDSGKEVILPTFKSFLWYTMRYFGFAVDFAMKNILGPKELKQLNESKLKGDYNESKK
ncbi:hypothetical protein CMI39_03265 [Candidatus Pacearchaeota archaeon]|jgi:hypothetical protein|nr:hypothetical protein [Candidatus Pacearchaeota archaeon]|tara:strand:+ start:679 stop:1527 length:849 start_codon:yes stop_codon:yes gene_type:complete